MPNFRSLWPMRLAILLLATGLFLSFLGHRSLWLDEAFSVWQGQQNQTTIWLTGRDLVHSPLYYSLLHFWVRLGATEGWVRLPSALAALLAVALLGQIGRRLADESAGRRAALLLAISPLTVWYAQEARMYAPLMTVGLGLALCLVRLAQTPATSGRLVHGRLLVVMTLVLVGGLYLDLPFLLLWAGLSGIWLGLWEQRGRDRTQLFTWLASSILGWLLAWPVWAYFSQWLAEIGRRVPLPLWLVAPTIFVGPFVVGWVAAAIRPFFVGEKISPPRRAERQEKIKQVFHWLMGLVMAGLFSGQVVWMLSPQWGLLKRLSLLFWPYLVLLVVLWFWQKGRPWWLRVITGLALLVTVFMQVTLPKDDWRGVVAYLNDAAAPDAPIWLASAADVLPYNYYQPDYPAHIGSLAQLQAAAATPSPLWLITGPVSNPTFQTWLSENRRLVNHISFYRIDIWKYE